MIHSFKHNVKSNLWKASNLSFNPVTLTGISYDWYNICQLIDGKLVLNTYNYSSTTVKHISKIRRLLEALHIKIELEVMAPQGLQDLTAAKKHYETIIEEKRTKMNKGIARLKEERQLEINDLKNTLNFINSQIA